MSQPTYARPGAPIPPDVAQLAGARGMGPWVQTYDAKRLGVWRLIGLGAFVLIPVALAVVFAAQAIWAGTIFMLLLASPFVWVASRAPNFNPSVAARKVYVFEQGMIEASKDGPVDYRWDQITTILQAITHTYRYGIKVASTYIYTVTRADGHVTKITHKYANIEQLGRHISQEVTEVLLPRAIGALRAGRTIEFGDISVNLGGIATPRKGSIPWTEIQKVTVNNGYVSLSKQGKFFSWSTKPAAKIPNLFVFLTLANQLAGGAR